MKKKTVLNFFWFSITKLILFILLTTVIFLITTPAQSRILKFYSFQELFELAPLVIQGTVLNVTETGEKGKKQLQNNPAQTTKKFLAKIKVDLVEKGKVPTEIQFSYSNVDYSGSLILDGSIEIHLQKNNRCRFFLKLSSNNPKIFENVLEGEFDDGFSVQLLDSTVVAPDSSHVDSRDADYSFHTVMIPKTNKVNYIEVERAVDHKIVQKIKTNNDFPNGASTYAQDVNFDGLADLVIVSDRTGKHEFWLFDQVHKIFLYNQILSNLSGPSIDTMNKEIKTYTFVDPKRICGTATVESWFIWNKDTLKKTREKTQDPLEDTKLNGKIIPHCRVTIRELKDERWITISSETKDQGCSC